MKYSGNIISWSGSHQVREKSITPPTYVGDQLAGHAGRDVLDLDDVISVHLAGTLGETADDVVDHARLGLAATSTDVRAEAGTG